MSKRLGIDGVNRLLSRVDDHVSSIQKSRQMERLCLSDTYLFWKRAEKVHPEDLRDFITAGLSFLTMSLATQIPVRGVLAYGSLSPRLDGVHGGTLTGMALVRAHELDRKHNLITLVVSPEAAATMAERSPGLAKAGLWCMRESDGALVCNPLGALIARLANGERLDELSRALDPVVVFCALALKFLVDQQEQFIRQGDYASREAQKYIGTVELIRRLSGASLFDEILSLARAFPRERLDRVLSALDATLRKRPAP